MAEELYVNDLRPDNDGSLDLVPRIETFQQLQDVFHVEVDRSMGWDVAPPGAMVFKLIGFSVRTGPSFFSQVYRADDSAFSGVLMCAHYPGHDVEPNWNPIPRYESPVFGDFTNAQGTWGLAIGGLLTDVDHGGPLTLFPNADPAKYSDAARKLGWYPMTDHLTPNPEWMYMVKPGGTTPDPTPGNAYIGVFSDDNLLYHIPLIPGTPSAQAGFSGFQYYDEDGNVQWHVPGVLGQP